MKKVLSLIVVFALFFTTALAGEAANKKYSWVVNSGIAKYKAKNYVGCIQDMAIVTAHDPSNAVAYYYLGNSYMKIGNKDKAINSYDRVIKLNTAPVLTSYAAQAKYRLTSGSSFAYKRLNSIQTAELLKDPDGYIKNMNNPPAVKSPVASSVPSLPSGSTPGMAPAMPSPSPEGSEPSAAPANPLNSIQSDPEIAKMINGKYNKIHPDANKVIIDAKLQKQMQDVNAGQKSAVPTDEQIAEAVKTLSKVGINVVQTPAQVQAQLQAQMNPSTIAQNNEYAAMTAMLGGNNQQYNNNSYNNNMMNMLPFLIQQGQQNGNNHLSADMVQTMMMSQMLPDFGFDSKPKY